MLGSAEMTSVEVSERIQTHYLKVSISSHAAPANFRQGLGKGRKTISGILF